MKNGKNSAGLELNWTTLLFGLTAFSKLNVGAFLETEMLLATEEPKPQVVSPAHVLLLCKAARSEELLWASAVSLGFSLYVDFFALLLILYVCLFIYFSSLWGMWGANNEEKERCNVEGLMVN